MCQSDARRRREKIEAGRDAGRKRALIGAGVPLRNKKVTAGGAHPALSAASVGKTL
jgi:hypothetical protein